MSVSQPIRTEAEFREDLVRHGHLIPSGEPGLVGRGAVFEDVLDRFDDLVTRVAAEDGPERLRFPPMVPKRVLEDVGYLKSFPNLAGAVFGFYGDDLEAGELLERAGAHGDWSDLLRQTEVVLLPAACYPAYPAIARRGRLPEPGVTLDLGGTYVYRNEPSDDPARLQMFHQREMVRAGSAEQVLDWREQWMDRARAIYDSLGVEAEIDLASDPFFGRGGRMLARNQRELQLKFEVIAPVAATGGTAITSFNYHQEHFSSAFGIEQSDGRAAHTACLGFGLERVTLALFARHGMDPAEWPQGTRRVLLRPGEASWP
jgi:seryl-tRNA synthetase